MNTTPKLEDLIIEGIRDRKGQHITIVDLSEMEGAAAHSFIIADGPSTTRVGAIADRVEEFVRETAGIKPDHIDGLRSAEWVVMDYGPVWVHLFLPEVRQHYNLEELWADAPITNLPDLD